MLYVGGKSRTLVASHLKVIAALSCFLFVFNNNALAGVTAVASKVRPVSLSTNQATESSMRHQAHLDRLAETTTNQKVLTNDVSLNNQTVKSFREWKQSVVLESENKIKSTQENITKVKLTNTNSQIKYNNSSANFNVNDPNQINTKSISKATLEAGLNPQLQALQDQADRERSQLLMANELTITDYFVGYLAKQKSLNAAIKEVSVKLSPEEVAELMTAYANNFFQSRPQPMKIAPRADSDQL